MQITETATNHANLHSPYVRCRDSEKPAKYSKNAHVKSNRREICISFANIIS